MVAASHKMNFGTVEAEYDRRVDVLSVRLGGFVDYEGDGLPGGIELDFALGDGAPCGLKVIGFQRNGWIEKIDELKDIASRHLALDPFIIGKSIDLAMSSL